jgi:hypothetical protein
MVTDGISVIDVEWNGHKIFNPEALIFAAGVAAPMDVIPAPLNLIHSCKRWGHEL